MSRKKRTLDDDVLAAFKRACHEEDWQIAEHLLQALEILACRTDDEDDLQRAYLEFTRSLSGRPLH
ncbi:MAG: hypothetical protein K2Y13_12475 [Burkholderiaceae bacterium]|uniref:Uncharacterized protein n=1 Tax=Herminiimonas contaminans TaxID=1111140 RepID=A0ABS0EW79_9BURK|nr:MULTISPECIES: hypothetical protein [Oxalobacteraceae]MBF8179081.1 hypothetical protein [Herminiimonas contaminans]MBX9800265.1 hypothetical protein [Burkholderiaceae bacterium]